MEQVTFKMPRMNLNLHGAGLQAAKSDPGALERAVRDLLLALGEDVHREGLRDTPARVARALTEMLSGRRDDAREHLERTFASASEDPVLVRDITFTSMCEHHLLPFSGRAHVAYIPNGRVVGLSKVARCVEVYARRLQLQEKLTSEVADAFMAHLAPKGVLVLIESSHSCMSVRGVRKPESRMLTIASRGVLQQDAALRRELSDLLRRS